MPKRIFVNRMKTGFDQGQNRLIEGIKIARSKHYTTVDELVEDGYDQKTAAGAMEALGFGDSMYELFYGLA